MDKINLFSFSDEEIEAFGKLEDDERIDYSYPDGFFRTANSLTDLPDTQTRIQMLKGLVSMICVM